MPAAIDADRLRERATVPAGRKTEDEPEAEAYERRGEHDRERQSRSAEHAGPLIAAELIGAKGVIGVGVRRREPDQVVAAGDLGDDQ